MRIVLQRVSRAEVRIRNPDGSTRPSGRIGRGFLVLVGFTPGDDDEGLAWMADKVIGLRLFADAEDKMNRALADVGGALLVVSQFTLYGDMRRGRRPSFDDAAPPELARALYEDLVRELRAAPLPVATGEFQAMMHVELVNDGPVTILLDSNRES